MGKSTISMAMFNSHVKLPECKYASDLNVGSKFWWLRYPEWIHCCNFTVAETGLGGWWFQPGRSALRRPSWWLVSTCWRQRLDLDLAHSVGKWWWYKCDIYIIYVKGNVDILYVQHVTDTHWLPIIGSRPCVSKKNCALPAMIWRARELSADQVLIDRNLYPEQGSNCSQYIYMYI